MVSLQFRWSTPRDSCDICEEVSRGHSPAGTLTRPLRGRPLPRGRGRGGDPHPPRCAGDLSRADAGEAICPLRGWPELGEMMWPLRGGPESCSRSLQGLEAVSYTNL